MPCDGGGAPALLCTVPGHAQPCEGGGLVFDSTSHGSDWATDWLCTAFQRGGMLTVQIEHYAYTEEGVTKTKGKDGNLYGMLSKPHPWK